MPPRDGSAREQPIRVSAGAAGHAGHGSTQYPSMSQVALCVWLVIVWAPVRVAVFVVAMNISINTLRG